MNKNILFFIFLFSLTSISFISAQLPQVVIPLPTGSGSTTIVEVNGSANHNDLQNIQGGTVTERFHLDATEYANRIYLYNQSISFYNWLATFLYNYNQTTPAINTILGFNYFNQTGTGLQSSGNTVSANISYFDDRYLAGNKVYFLWNVSSGVVGYNIMNTTLSNRTQQTQSFSGLSGNQTIAKWINPNTNLTFIPSGLGEVHLHIQQTAGTKTVVFYVNVSIRRVDNTEYQLAISETSDILTGGNDQLSVHIYFPSTILNISDRMEFELVTVTSGAGTAPSVNIYTEGTTASHLSLPANQEDFNPIEIDPLWTANYSRVAFKDQSNIFTVNQTIDANLNVTGNVTAKIHITRTIGSETYGTCTNSSGWTFVGNLSNGGIC